MIVEISAQAEADIRAHVAWLKQHSPQAGRKASLRILHTIDLLADFPDLGSVSNGVIREKTIQFGRDGYVIVYRRQTDCIVIERVRHGRQDRSR